MAKTGPTELETPLSQSPSQFPTLGRCWQRCLDSRQSEGLGLELRKRFSFMGPTLSFLLAPLWWL